MVWGLIDPALSVDAGCPKRHMRQAEDRALRALLLLPVVWLEVQSGIRLLGGAMASPRLYCPGGEGRVECSTCYLPCSLWKVTFKAQT